jgi:catalase
LTGLAFGNVVAKSYESHDWDDYTQAGNLWRIFFENEKKRPAKAIAGALSGARQVIQTRKRQQ